MNLSPLLLAIAENLRTQDNRITSNPVFVVQKKTREYSNDFEDGVAWMDGDWEEADAETAAPLEAEYEATGHVPADWTRIGCQDRWEFVQPFFTEDGAKEYLRINGHNVRGETRIFVESGWRNAEWEAIRELLLSLGAKDSDSPGGAAGPGTENTDPRAVHGELGTDQRLQSPDVDEDAETLALRTLEADPGEAPAAPVTPSRGLFTRDTVAAWLRDRAHQWDEESGVPDIVRQLARGVEKGEVEEADAHGELDDLVESARKRKAGQG